MIETLMEEPVTLPSYTAGDVVLRDGSTVRVRPVQKTDEPRLIVLLQSLSEQDRWFRFFAPTKDSVLAAEAHRELTLDRTFGLVACSGPEERIVGHAFYAIIEDDRAEVAFTIANDYQGRGLATILLGQLADVAASNGVHVFEAEVTASNHAMLRVFRESGFPIHVTAGAGQLHVTFPTAFSADAVERFERRAAIAAQNALKAFFNPRSIAVIGASRKRGTIGGEIFRNLLTYGFEGAVYPVNPSAKVVQSVPTYASVEDIDGPVDLAIIVVPAAQVVEAAAACGRKGVKALVVVSAGFAETGEEGKAKQADLVRVCREAGMRLIGPNCMGIANTDPTVRLNGTFAASQPPHGKIGFSSQSGALGFAIMEFASSFGLGLSTFISVGNKADISGNDLLRYWEADDGTDIILLYLESFGNPKKFSQIARRVGRRKPIVVVKSGRSVAGARATSSHTGALIAASDITVDALFRQAGVIRTDTLSELFDVAKLLAAKKLPNGRRVAIVTNAGGPGILCADTCEAQGHEIPVLAESTRTKLLEFLLPGASAMNPIDLIASAPAEHYRRTLEIVAADPNVDALIVIFTPPLVTHSSDVAREIKTAVQQGNIEKPVLTVFLSASGAPAELRENGSHIPSYQFPETPAIALGRVTRYREWRDRPESQPPVFTDIRRDEAAGLIAMALQQGDGWLTNEETAKLFSCYGLPLVEQRVVYTPEQTAEAAAQFRGPVALKVIAPGVLHKTEAGGVRLNLADGEQVGAVALEMQQSMKDQGHEPTGFIVQPMIQGGVEMLVGMVHDPQFGPVIACGAGGTQVEVIRDVSVRLTPLSHEDAREMIHSLKTYPLLTGFRGSVKCDIKALEDGLLRVSAMVEDLPQIAELDCNPFVVHEHGAVILDARVRVVAPQPRPLRSLRR